MNECKKRGWHNWSGVGKGNFSNVDTYSESYEEMTVIFKCSDCKSEAEGRVFWKNDFEQ